MLNGARVRVKESRSNPELLGQTGIVRQRYTLNSYTVFQVQFEGERIEIFWQHELEEVTGHSS